MVQEKALLGCISGLHSISDGNILWMGENILNISQYFNNLHFIGHKMGLNQFNCVSKSNLLCIHYKPRKIQNELNSYYMTHFQK